jgi:DNA-binding response OmpR family regulator
VVSAKKILIVSAGMVLYRRLKNRFSERIYDIIHTSKSDNGLKAIIDKVTPDIIVIDPEVSAARCVELSLRIRQWTPIPILILTTNNTLENEVRSLDLTVDNCVSDPFDIAVVVARIGQIISSSPGL